MDLREIESRIDDAGDAVKYGKANSEEQAEYAKALALFALAKVIDKAIDKFLGEEEDE